MIEEINAAETVEDAPENSGSQEVAEAVPNVVLQNFPVALDDALFSRLPAFNAALTLVPFRKAEAMRGKLLVAEDDKDSYDDIYESTQFLRTLGASVKATCKDARDPAWKEHQSFIALENSLTAWIEGISAPLMAQRKIYEDAKRKRDEEKKRLKAEQTEKRAKQMQELGAPFNLKACSDFSEKDWETFITPYIDAKAKKDRTKARAAELKAIGSSAESTDYEDLDDAEYEKFLQAEVDAAAERKRKKDAENEKQCKYMIRFNFLAGKGFTVDSFGISLESLRDMTDDEYLDLTIRVEDRAKANAESARLDRLFDDRRAALLKLGSSIPDGLRDFDDATYDAFHAQASAANSLRLLISSRLAFLRENNVVSSLSDNEIGALSSGDFFDHVDRLVQASKPVPVAEPVAEVAEPVAKPVRPSAVIFAPPREQSAPAVFVADPELAAPALAALSEIPVTFPRPDYPVAMFCEDLRAIVMDHLKRAEFVVIPDGIKDDFDSFIQSIRDNVKDLCDLVS